MHEFLLRRQANETEVPRKGNIRQHYKEGVEAEARGDAKAEHKHPIFVPVELGRPRRGQNIKSNQKDFQLAQINGVHAYVNYKTILDIGT